jgi:hypothetical protein
MDGVVAVDIVSFLDFLMGEGQFFTHYRSGYFLSGMFSLRLSPGSTVFKNDLTRVLARLLIYTLPTILYCHICRLTYYRQFKYVLSGLKWSSVRANLSSHFYFFGRFQQRFRFHYFFFASTTTTTNPMVPYLKKNAY